MRGPGGDPFAQYRIGEVEPFDAGAELGVVGGIGEPEDRPRIGDDVRAPLRRQARIHRHVRRTGFGDGPDREHRFDGPGEADGDHIARPDAAVDQFPRQARGELVELGVAELAPPWGQTGRFIANGNRIRGRFHRGGQQLNEEKAPRPPTRSPSNGTTNPIHPSLAFLSVEPWSVPPSTSSTVPWRTVGEPRR
ncbi:hypothetical protein Ntsu_49280 [Nocardia sp. IFM 10818]